MTDPVRLNRFRTLFRAVAKRPVAAMIEAVPAAIRERILRRAALLPPVIKGHTFERLCAMLSRNIARERLIVTNLGVASPLRCSVPIHKSQYAFGRPHNNLVERATFDLVTGLAKDCLHFVDVGAHEGIYTFGVSAERGKQVRLHWFEPDRILCQRLSMNCVRNAIEVRGNGVAAAANSGWTTFFRNLTDDASGSLATDFAGRHVIEPEAVRTISLDDYFASNEITWAIVKIDVEGAGFRVWSGLQRSFTDIVYLIIEMLAPEIKAKLPCKIMEQTGWRGYYVRDFDLIESKRGEFEYREPFWNWLFCGLAPAALARRLSGTKFRVVPALSEPE